MSEHEPQRELKLPWRADRAADGAEGSAAQSGSWDGEARGIGDVVRLGTELQAHPFCYRELFEHRVVQMPAGRPTEYVHSRVSGSVEWLRNKGRGVEPLLDGRVGQISAGNSVGPIRRASVRAGRIVGDGERQASRIDSNQVSPPSRDQLLFEAGRRLS